MGRSVSNVRRICEMALQTVLLNIPLKNSTDLQYVHRIRKPFRNICNIKQKHQQVKKKTRAMIKYFLQTWHRIQNKIKPNRVELAGAGSVERKSSTDEEMD